MYKKHKGITLIALIITIIVMLILVAVSIQTVINSGLFDSAKNAAIRTEEAYRNEANLGEKVIVDGKEYNSIEEYRNYINENGKTEQAHTWTRTSDTFTCSHCNVTYEMGQKVNYTAEGTNRTTITAERSGLDTYYTEKSSYPTDANVDDNGNQTIEVQSANWVVLGIEDTDGDEINETLLITTENPVGVTADNGLWLYLTAEYNNGPDIINEICGILYSNSSFGTARGMTLEDVNSAVKLLPEWNYTSWNYYHLNNDGTCLINDNSGTREITTAEKNMIFGASNNFDYMLASCSDPSYGRKGLIHISNSYVTNYSLWIFDEEGLWWAGPTSNIDYDMHLRGYNFRPVVPLTDNLPTITN